MRDVLVSSELFNFPIEYRLRVSTSAVSINRIHLEFGVLEQEMALRFKRGEESHTHLCVRPLLKNVIMLYVLRISPEA